MNSHKELFCSITGMDVHIIIDSIADIMSHEDKDLCKTGELAIQIIFETIAIVLQDKLKVTFVFPFVNICDNVLKYFPVTMMEEFQLTAQGDGRIFNALA